MKRLPLVTIIMPVRNEASFIERSLASVLGQNYPLDRTEIIVSDGMSEDNTRTVISSMQSRHPNLRMIDNPGRIVSTGLNAAFREAKGEIIIRIDGHCEIAPDYVRRCVHSLLSEKVDGVGGPIETIGETKCAQAIALAMSSTFGVGGSPFRAVKNRTRLVDTVAFPAYTRGVLEQAGPFDEELVRNQDDEFNYRLRKLGGRILLDSDIRSRYYSRGTLRSLWRQYFQYGYWKVRVMQKHPRQMQLRQFVPVLFVAAILITLLAATISTVGAWMFGLLATIYLIANLASSVLLARQGNWALLPYLPVTFAALHFGYGVGFMIGLVHFWNRWEQQRKPLIAIADAQTKSDTGLQSV